MSPRGCWRYSVSKLTVKMFSFREQGRAVTPEPIEEKEEEDNTLYCICKKPFSEDSSTMVECDV